MKQTYKVLKNNQFESGDFKIVPIRFEDRFAIMQWRNEQIYHLRQDKPLTVADQDAYFEQVVMKLFDQEKPNQLLFSYLEGDVLIGYGGLVHINWIDRNAEISLVLESKFSEKEFQYHWCTYLTLLEQVAFSELSLHKIYTFAFDLRPHLYEALTNQGFSLDAVLKEHCLFNNEFIDVVIHEKRNKYLNLREVTMDDAELLFDWVNNKLVRQNSLQVDPIPWETHLKWLENKIKSLDSNIFILEANGTSVGQIRIDKSADEDYWLIDYSIDEKQRRNGYGLSIVQQLVRTIHDKKLVGIVKNNNIASQKVFEKLLFKKQYLKEEELIKFSYGE